MRAHPTSQPHVLRCLLADRKKFQELAPSLLGFVQSQWASCGTQVLTCVSSFMVGQVCDETSSTPSELALRGVKQAFPG